MEKENALAHRDFYLDNTKFFLITMVIWSHVLSSLCEGGICHRVDSFLYFFHMPLFIFISGYFTKVNDPAGFWKSIGRLLETLIIFNIIHVIIRIALGKIVIGEEGFWSILYTPQWSLWYLLSLIWWRFIVFVSTRKFHLSPVKVFAFSVVLGLVAGFIPVGRELSFQRTFFFLPFFALGYLCKNVRLDLAILRKIPVYVAAIILLLVLAGSLFTDFEFKARLMGCFPYYRYDAPLIVSLAVRIGTYLACFVTAVCVLRCMPRREIKWISAQGAHTLHYYLYHTIIIYLFMVLGLYIKLPTTIYMSVCYLLVVVLVAWGLQRIKFFRSLPNIVSENRIRR